MAGVCALAPCIENLKNRQVTTVASALDTVICVYHQQHLVIGTINVDGEFEPLQEVSHPSVLTYVLKKSMSQKLNITFGR